MLTVASWLTSIITWYIQLDFIICQDAAVCKYTISFITSWEFLKHAGTHHSYKINLFMLN